MSRVWVTVAATLFIAAGGVDHWIRYSRAHSPELRASVIRVDSLPMAFGSWSGRFIDVDEALVKKSTAKAVRIVEYHDGNTGQMVTIALLAGQPGLMAENLPESGFAAMGFSFEPGSLKRHDISTWAGDFMKGQFASLDFRHPDSSQPMRVWQSWYDGTEWSRPDMPRLRFATKPVLYRLQVWSYLAIDPLAADGKAVVDPSKVFLQAALPEITRILSGKVDETSAD